ncbi:hypothetical protein BH10BAC5_BH10BAC5_26800 [soil metagenome]
MSLFNILFRTVVSSYVFLILFSTSSNAQEVIDYKKAVNTAFQNSSLVTTVYNDIDRQKYNITIAKGNLLPSLSLSAGWSRNLTDTKGGFIVQNGIPIPVSSNSTGRNNYSASLSANYTIFNGFANNRQIDLEEENQQYNLFNLEKQRRSLIIAVTRNYIDILKKEKIIVANRDNLTVSQAQLLSIREYFNVGKKIIGDVYKQEVLVSQNDLKVEQSINELLKTKVDLLLTMNVNPDKEFTVNESDFNINMTDAEIVQTVASYQNIEVLVGKAKQNRFEYKNAMQSISISELNYDISNKAFLFPTISAFGNYSYSGDAIGNIDNNRVLNFGINLSYSIFQGWNLDSKRQQSDISIKQKRQDLYLLENQFRSDIKKAKYDLETAYKQYAILDKSLQSALQDRTLSEESYRLGLATLLDVQTSTTNYNNIVINRITTLYDFLQAKKQLEYLTGEIKY